MKVAIIFLACVAYTMASKAMIAKDFKAGEVLELCKANGEILLHPDSRCKYVECTYGDEPWQDDEGNYKFYPVERSCPAGTAVSRSFYGHDGYGYGSEGRDLDVRTLCADRVAVHGYGYNSVDQCNVESYAPHAYGHQGYGYNTHAHGAPAYGSHNQGYGYNAHNQGYGTHNQGYGTHNQGYGTHNQGYGTHNQGYGTHNQGYGTHNQGYGAAHNQGYGYNTHAHGAPAYGGHNQGYGYNTHNQGYGAAHNQGYGSYQTQGYVNREYATEAPAAATEAPTEAEYQ